MFLRLFWEYYPKQPILLNKINQFKNISKLENIYKKT